MPYERITYRRTELYELVWAEPVRTVAKRFGVSDVALAKVCRKLAVPLPARGHWARKAAGQKVRNASLPKAPKGVPEELHVERWRPERDDPAAPVPDEAPARVAFEKTPDAAITVPDVLERPHRLVASAGKLLRREKPDDYGRVHCSTETCLDISVGPASIDRALRLMDTLLKAATDRGYRGEVTARRPYGETGYGSRDPSNETRIVVDDIPIKLRLFEKATEERAAPPTPPRGMSGSDLEFWVWRNKPRLTRTPNGTFELTLDGGYRASSTFTDRETGRLETRLNDVLAKLPVLANRVRESNAEQERERLRQEEETRRRHEALRRAEEEKRKAEQLVTEVDRWRLAQAIRAYVSELRNLGDSYPTATGLRPALDEKLTWATAYAQSIDPVAAIDAELRAALPSDDASRDLGGTNDELDDDRE